ncbi:hypothetical protein PC950_005179, partial [Citrobacter freundii]
KKNNFVTAGNHKLTNFRSPKSERKLCMNDKRKRVKELMREATEVLQLLILLQQLLQGSPFT